MVLWLLLVQEQTKSSLHQQNLHFTINGYQDFVLNKLQNFVKVKLPPLNTHTNADANTYT